MPTTNVDSLMEMLEIQQTLLYPEQSPPLTSAHPPSAFPPLPHLTRPLLPLILTNFHLLPPLAMAERIEPLPGAPRAMPPLSFLHSILHLMVGLPDTPSDVLPRAPPRLPLRHTPSLDRASPQPTPSFKSEPMKLICLPGSAVDPTLVDGSMSAPDSLRQRLIRSHIDDDANGGKPAMATRALLKCLPLEARAGSHLEPVLVPLNRSSMVLMPPPMIWGNLPNRSTPSHTVINLAGREMAMMPTQLSPDTATVTYQDPLEHVTVLALGIAAGTWGIPRAVQFSAPPLGLQLATRCRHKTSSTTLS